MINSFNNFKINNLEKYISSICQYEYMYFLSKPNVVGVALGYKIKNNISTSQMCITVFVKKKISKFSLCYNNLIPKKYKGIPTDVIESGEFHDLSLTNKIRPVQGGYSISNELSRSAGTMTCVVKDLNNDYYVLGNNHVLALRNSAPLGSRIIQPGILDGGIVATDTIATLSKFIELKYGTPGVSPENFVDCAIAKVLNKAIVTPIIAKVGLPKEPINPQLGLLVKKVGKNSELTNGNITDINGTLQYDTPKGTILFKNQIIVNLISQSGDSGALLLNSQDNRSIGLLIAGSDKGQGCYCPITTVLNSLDVALVTSLNIIN